MRKGKASGLKRILLILCCMHLAFLPGPSEVRAGNMGIFEKAQARMVNVEATYLLHVLKLVQWNDKDLPAKDKPVKCLIVGQDKTSFLERFGFLVSESNVTLSGRQITVHGVEKMKDAMDMAHRDSAVVLVVALESAAGQWNKFMYPKRSGLLVYGQSEKYSGHGMAMFSKISHNRVKISINFRKASAKGLILSPELLRQDRIFFVDRQEE